MPHRDTDFVLIENTASTEYGVQYSLVIFTNAQTKHVKHVALTARSRRFQGSERAASTKFAGFKLLKLKLCLFIFAFFLSFFLDAASYCSVMRVFRNTPPLIYPLSSQ